MIREPGYYRDMLNRLLNEAPDDDDVPVPPTRSQLKFQQLKRTIPSLRNLSISELPFTVEDSDGWLIFNTKNISIPMSDGHHIVGMEAGIDVHGGSSYLGASVDPPYDDDDHPYTTDDPDAVDAIQKWFSKYGFNVELMFSESGMQESDFLHFDVNASPETEELLTQIAQAQD